MDFKAQTFFSNQLFQVSANLMPSFTLVLNGSIVRLTVIAKYCSESPKLKLNPMISETAA